MNFFQTVIPCYDDDKNVQALIDRAADWFFQKRYTESANCYRLAAAGKYEEDLWLNVYRNGCQQRRYRQALNILRWMIKCGCTSFWKIDGKQELEHSYAQQQIYLLQKRIAYRYRKRLQALGVAHIGIACNIMQMAYDDQLCLNARMQKGKYPNAYSGDSLEAIREQTQQTFLRNNRYARQVFDQVGFPGLRELGKQAARGFWLMVLHSDFDIGFQKAYLKQMKLALKQGNTDPAQLAFLIDRVRKAAGKKQLYGTQLAPAGKDIQQGIPARLMPALWPVENVTELNTRRRRLGLEPVRDYLQLVTAVLNNK